MATTTIPDIKDFHDVIRLLEEHPEWRAELRRVVLTDDLLALPQQVARLTEQVAALATAQVQTEARIAELVAAQARTDTQLATLTARVDELAAAQARTEAQLAALTKTVHRLSDDVGTLKGDVLELRYGMRGIPSIGRMLRRPHVLSSDEVYELLDSAVDRGILSLDERDQLAEADLIVSGRDQKTGTEVYVVMEVSWGVGPGDVRRAAHRAALLAKIGIPTFPAVAGREITPEAREQAARQGVWQFIDGTVAPPVS
ncbi:MAG: DNA-binding protein [Candidatus Binatia bacterium]|nr:DNA-binding protein [Candidatus Binatia bacterium]